MKMFPLPITLLVSLTFGALVSPEVRADTGIAAEAINAKSKPVTISTTSTTTTTPATNAPALMAPAKDTADTTTPKPATPKVETTTTATTTAADVPSPTEATGIKAPPGKTIDPTVQNAGVATPVQKIRPQQEDYHTVQAN